MLVRAWYCSALLNADAVSHSRGLCFGVVLLRVLGVLVVVMVVTAAVLLFLR